MTFADKILTWMLWVVVFAIGTIVLLTAIWRGKDRYLNRRDRQHREALQRAQEGEADHDDQR